MQDRRQVRSYFLAVRRKYDNNEPLEPLESLILDVLLAHPEYDYLLEQGEALLDADFSPESGQGNPFLHMSMHIAIKEQIQADRPAGIRALCTALADRYGDAHEMEHQVMECLGEVLWQAQRDKRMPDEAAYLENVRALQ